MTCKHGLKPYRDGFYLSHQAPPGLWVRLCECCDGLFATLTREKTRCDGCRD